MMAAKVKGSLLAASFNLERLDRDYLETGACSLLTK
jgi:hypothetical protein